MMRGMLILGLLVGMVGTVGAEALSGGGGSGGVTPTTEEAIWIDTPFVMVDKKVLRELLAEAQRDGVSLNVFVYEYDDKQEVWDRARPAPCLEKMQAAMEAIEATWTVSSDSYDGCNHCWEGGCTLLACLNGGNEVARLEWELKRAKEAIERKAKLDQLWTEARACWRKP